MREGFTTEDNNKAAERRRRRGSEVIDEEEAPQVVIQEKDKDAINAEEARAFVAEKAGVKAQGTTGEVAKETGPVKAREENVSLGMMKKKRKNEGVRRAVDTEKGEKREEESWNKEKLVKNGLGKTKQTAQRKEKRLKLSFEEDE